MNSSSRILAQPAAEAPSYKMLVERINLPSAASDLCVGGNGRYILLKFPATKNVGVFDVDSQKLTGMLQVDSNLFSFAAGRTKALTLDAMTGTLTRWDLATLQKEQSKSLSLEGRNNVLLMGSDTEGPAFLDSKRDTASFGKFEIDLNSLEKSDAKFIGDAKFSVSDAARMSANGQVISFEESFFTSLVKTSSGQWTRNGIYLQVGQSNPSGDGRLLLTRAGIFRNNLREFSNRSLGPQISAYFGSNILIPAISGPLYLSIPFVENIALASSSSSEKPPQVSIRIMGFDHPIASLPDVETLSGQQSTRSSGSVPVDKQIIFIPHLNRILSLTQKFDQIRCISFDIQQALRQAAVDFLVVDSTPITHSKIDAPYEYSLSVVSKSKNLKYSIASGPKEMQIDGDGKVTWRPTNNEPLFYNVVINVSNENGAETYHSYRLDVEGGKAENSAVVREPTSTSLPATPPLTASSFDGDKIEVPFSGVYEHLLIGGSGRYLIGKIPSQNRIGVLDVAQAKMLAGIPCDDAHSLIAAGKEKLLIYSPKHDILTKYNLHTLEKELILANPLPGTIRQLSLASGLHENPLAIYSTIDNQQYKTTYASLDIDNLTPVDLNTKDKYAPRIESMNRVAAARDVNSFFSPGQSLVRLRDTQLEVSAIDYAVPFSDGNLFMTTDFIGSRNGNPPYGKRGEFEYSIPSVSGRFYVSLKKVDMRNFLGARIYLVGKQDPIGLLPDVSLDLTMHTDTLNNPLLSAVFLIPDAHVLAVISKDRKSVFLHRFDSYNSLAESGAQYLFLRSFPNTSITPGQTFSYQMEAAYSSKALKYALVSGPDAMTVSDSGLLTWKVPDTLNTARTGVILRVDDAEGQTDFQSFDLICREFKALKPNTPPSSPTVTQNSSSTEPAVRTWTDSTGKSKIDATFVELQNDEQVVLQDTKGQRKVLPLNRLSPSDMFYAVETQLNRKKAVAAPKQSNEPPTPSPSNATAKDTAPIKDTAAAKAPEETKPKPKRSKESKPEVTPEIKRQLEARIAEMNAILDKGDLDALLNNILHPSLRSGVPNGKLQEKHLKRIQAALKEFDTTQLTWTTRDTLGSKGTGLTFGKDNGVWYINSK